MLCCGSLSFGLFHFDQLLFGAVAFFPGLIGLLEKIWPEGKGRRLLSASGIRYGPWSPAP